MMNDKWLYIQYFNCNDEIYSDIIIATKDAMKKKIQRDINKAKKYLGEQKEKTQDSQLSYEESICEWNGYILGTVHSSDGQDFFHKAIPFEKVKTKELKK